jgi:triacylglycerol lipase
MKTVTRAVMAAAALALAATGASAQVTPAMKAKIAAIGRIVDPSSTAPLYRPLQPTAPYKGVKVTRDIHYGPDAARNVLDVFTPAAGIGARPVLLFVPGGPGNKIEPVPGGEAFYDNVMLWAAKNGMVGVNMQRRGQNFDDSARDVSSVIQWVQANIAKYGGDPSRIYIWGHSAGAMSVANYLAHPAFYGPQGVGVKGAVLMAGPYNLAPFQPKDASLQIRMTPGAPVTTMGGRPADPAGSQAAGLKALTIPLFVCAAELDPPNLVELADELNRELTAAGRAPKFAIFKDHGHMSEIFAVNTADVSTSKPVLDFIRSIR